MHSKFPLQARASRTNNSCGCSLTPALSRWERENRSLLQWQMTPGDCTPTHENPLGVHPLFPLPVGEGQGEGELIVCAPSLAKHLALIAVFFILLPFAMPASAATKDAVFDIGNRRQVFIDGRFLASSKDVDLVVHPPRKTGERTLVADRRWEGRGIGTYDTVMYVDGVYHLWYSCRGGICYARSEDGITWEKPNLGLTSYKGTREEQHRPRQRCQWNHEAQFRRRGLL